MRHGNMSGDICGCLTGGASGIEWVGASVLITPQCQEWLPTGMAAPVSPVPMKGKRYKPVSQTKSRAPRPGSRWAAEAQWVWSGYILLYDLVIW